MPEYPAPSLLRAWADSTPGGVTELARRLGVERKTLYHWLRGSSRPGVVLAVRMEALSDGVLRPVDWLSAEERVG